MSEEERLFGAYNTWRLQTASVTSKPFRRTLASKPERLRLMGRMAAWCRERDLDPRLWLYWLFRSRKWMFAPKLEPGVLMTSNPKMIERYRWMVDRKCLDGYRLNRDRPAAIDPNVDLVGAAEDQKRAHRRHGQSHICMRETPVTTYGFHPKSKTCVECPIANECATNLRRLVGFDIIALREGRMSVAEARGRARERP